METVDRLWAIEQIKQLKARYFRFLDTKDWEGMRTIWTDDAVFDARTAKTIDASGAGTDAADWVWTGCDAIVSAISAVANLPTSDPDATTHTWTMTPAEEMALGLMALSAATAAAISSRRGPTKRG